MNEQRKVIYKRRQQILDGGDLRDEAVDAIAGAVQHAVDTWCPNDYPEEWDLEELHRQIQITYPTKVSLEQLRDVQQREGLIALLSDDALEQYEAKEREIGSDRLREIERRVMLSVIDQHWREHLYEMDYLREGINLRAMGQKDPLAEWQREGFDMFSAMMDGIQDNFVRYVSHLQVVAEDAPRKAPRNVRYSSADGPVQGSGALRAAAASGPPPEVSGNGDELAPVAAAPQAAPAEDTVQQPVRVEKTPGRNEPCWCGSGKKFKLCHGR
jgi:preprotein translocase subunit SecA